MVDTHILHSYPSAATTPNFLREATIEIIPEIDLPKLLATNALEGIVLSPKRIAEYELVSLQPRSDESNSGFTREWSGMVDERIEYSLYLDTPVGFCLTYKGLPNALGGIAMLDSDEVMLRQLQGVRGKIFDGARPPADTSPIPKTSARGLMPLDWRKLMVEIMEQVSESTGVSSVAIQSSANNFWVGQGQLSTVAAETTYDRTAQRLGYRKHRFSKKKKDWHKSL